MTTFLGIWSLLFVALAAAVVLLFFYYGGDGDVIDLGNWRKELAVAALCSLLQAALLFAVSLLGENVLGRTTPVAVIIAWLVYRFSHLDEMGDREAIGLGLVQMLLVFGGGFLISRGMS